MKIDFSYTDNSCIIKGYGLFFSHLPKKIMEFSISKKYSIDKKRTPLIKIKIKSIIADYKIPKEYEDKIS